MKVPSSYQSSKVHQVLVSLFYVRGRLLYTGELLCFYEERLDLLQCSR